MIIEGLAMYLTQGTCSEISAALVIQMLLPSGPNFVEEVSPP